VIYGGGGVMEIELVERGGKRGLRLTFQDRGPGIPDIQEALRDGFTTGGGLGLGLGGAKRLANEFYIESDPGKGTKVTIARWRS
jgi:serine/threonine-protein kinase RsbT